MTKESKPRVAEARPHIRISLSRKIFTDRSTIGEITIGKLRLFTLEDTVRRRKVLKKTAIPAGRYRLTLGNSPKFGYCPFIHDVPFFDDIRIHVGNDPEDTEGCILVGKTYYPGSDFIGSSRTAFGELMATLKPLSDRGDIWIDVIGGLGAEDMDGA